MVESLFPSLVLPSWLVLKTGPTLYTTFGPEMLSCCVSTRGLLRVYVFTLYFQACVSYCATTAKNILLAKTAKKCYA